jgi:hypothetical protein
MINQAEETLITLKEAAENFGGVSIPYNTLLYYVYQGVRGIKLETIRINRRYTSREAIQRFIDRRQGVEPKLEKPKHRQMSQEEVQRILKRHGIIK